MEKSKFDLEKIGVYVTLLIGFLTVIIYIADMKERIAKLESKDEISLLRERTAKLEVLITNKGE